MPRFPGAWADILGREDHCDAGRTSKRQTHGATPTEATGTNPQGRASERVMKRTSRFLALMGGLSLSAEFGKAAALTTVRVSGARAAGGDCGRREASVASSPSPRWLGQPSAVTRLEQ